MNVKREAKNGRTVGLRGDGKRQERPQWVFCSRAGDKTGGLYMGEQREKRKSTGSLPCFLAGEVYVLAWEHLLEWGRGAVSLF